MHGGQCEKTELVGLMQEEAVLGKGGSLTSPRSSAALLISVN